MKIAVTLFVGALLIISAIADGEGSESSLTFKKEKVVVKVKPEDQLRDVAAALSKLQSEVEVLTSDVQKSKQKIMEDAKINNVASIDLTVSDTDRATIRNLIVKVDGYNVYWVSETSGLWLPTKQIPLYHGPLESGIHRVEFEASLVLRRQEGMPLNSDVYRVLKTAYNIEVPAGTVKKRWLATILVPASTGPDSKAKLKMDFREVITNSLVPELVRSDEAAPTIPVIENGRPKTASAAPVPPTALVAPEEKPLQVLSPMPEASSERE